MALLTWPKNALHLLPNLTITLKRKGLSMLLDYRRIGIDAYRSLGQVHAYVVKALEPQLVALVYLRVSQINGCAYCIDLHWREALKAGVPARKLNLVIAWAESDAFDARERAAFSWAEALSRIADAHPSEELYRTVLKQFGDQATVDLTYAIALMNAFNRLGVGFRQGPDLRAEVSDASA